MTVVDDCVCRRMTFVMDQLYAPGTRSGAELVKETMNEACRQKRRDGIFQKSVVPTRVPMDIIA